MLSQLFFFLQIPAGNNYFRTMFLLIILILTVAPLYKTEKRPIQNSLQLAPQEKLLCFSHQERDQLLPGQPLCGRLPHCAHLCSSSGTKIIGTIIFSALKTRNSNLKTHQRGSIFKICPVDGHIPSQPFQESRLPLFLKPLYTPLNVQIDIQTDTGCSLKLCFSLKCFDFFLSLPVLLQRWCSTCLMCVYTC